MEDTAIHKSVGEYVDRDARAKATARTCYTKKQGLFLPQFGCLWSPVLMREYKASLTYAEYEPEMLSPDGMADAYAKQILSYVSRKGALISCRHYMILPALYYSAGTISSRHAACYANRLMCTCSCRKTCSGDVLSSRYLFPGCCIICSILLRIQDYAHIPAILQL